MKSILAVMVALVAAAEAAVVGTKGVGCVEVQPAENFVNAMYEGRWYEIGRIQTPGGATFQKDCWCDTTDFHSETQLVGDGEATYSCRKHGTDGEITSATADLFYNGAAGKFQQQFRFPFAPKLDYNVVYVDENVAMEYDCGTTLGITNYCIHIMARTPHLDDATVDFLIKNAESLGLNTQNITYKATEQDGCW